PFAGVHPALRGDLPPATRRRHGPGPAAGDRAVARLHLGAHPLRRHRKRAPDPHQRAAPRDALGGAAPDRRGPAPRAGRGHDALGAGLRMDTTPEHLASRLGNDPLAPAYLIAGPEPLRVLEGADAVRAAARGEGITEREVFEAEGNQREPDWGAMAASLRAPGLFAARRLVELRLPTGKPGTEGSKLLLEYC